MPTRRHAASLAAFALAGCATKPAPQGPLPVRNQHPAQQLVMQMPPASPRTQGAGRASVRADAAYSSLWLVGSDPGSGKRWVMDGEYLRSAATVRYGLGGGVEAAIELPFAHTGGGFLDDFLIDYHDFFGFPDQDRDVAPRDDYQVQLTRNNGADAVWGVDRASVAMLDVPLYATWQLTPATGKGPAVAVRGGLELPTGDADAGYGSGEVEPSVGLLLDLPGQIVHLYGHAQYTWAGTPDQAARAGLQFADVAAAGVAAEAPLHDDLHAYVQLAWEQSTLRNFGLPETDDDQALLWVGGRFRASEDVALEVGFGEDLIALVSPDFTAWVGMVWNPGAWRRRSPTPLPR